MNTDQQQFGTCPVRHGGEAVPAGPNAQAGAPVIWLKGYEEVLEAFKVNGLRMASYDGAKSTIFADVLITLDGSDHLARRRLETSLVRPAMLAFFEHDAVPASARHLIASAASNGRADLVHLTKLIATSTAAQIVGLDLGDEPGALEELCALMAQLHEGVVIEWSTRPRERVLEDVRQALARYRERFFLPALHRRDSRRADPLANRDGLDLIQLLVLNRDVAGLSDEQILRETVHYLAATAHTSATVVMHACHELWVWLDEHPEDASRRDDPVFLQACINEAMRLWPPSGWAFRIATSNLTLKSGRRIAIGEKLGLHLIDANRDPTIFGPDADRFNPRRVTPGHVPAYGLAFGAGVHVCLGRRLAAGTPGDARAPGTLVAKVSQLLAAGCRPDPERPPVLQQGTQRHQFSLYPIRFSDRTEPVAAIDCADS
jgi:cytochrome P450